MISLASYLGFVTGIIIMIFLSLYPFYLKKYKKDRYKGMWLTLGEMHRSPQRALLLPAGFIIGLIIATLIDDYINNKAHIAIIGFSIMLIFILVTYGFRIFILEQWSKKINENKVQVIILLVIAIISLIFS